MAYNIVYKKSVERDLKHLPRVEAAKVLDQIQDRQSEKPEDSPILRGRFAGLRKYRIGDYRVIYAVIGSDVLILRVGHRRDVYRHRI